MSQHQYPQKVFGTSVRKQIAAYQKGQNWDVLDAPCGNGETTYLISKLPNINIHGVDVNAQSIETAKGNFKADNLKYECGDIFSHLEQARGRYNAMCIINSLYLFQDQERLLQLIADSLKDGGVFCVIFPNPVSKNYTYFKKHNPEVNVFEFTAEEFKPMLAKFGFKFQSVDGIVHASPFLRKEKRFFSIFAPVYMGLINSLAKLSSSSEPSYYILTATR